MSNFYILFMFYSTNVGVWLVFCKDIWISQQHSRSCHKVHRMWLLMLVWFPYNLFKIISGFMLVIYIKIYFYDNWKEERKKQPSLEMGKKLSGILFPQNIRKEVELTIFPVWSLLFPLRFSVWLGWNIFVYVDFCL